MTLIASTLLAAFLAAPTHAEPSTWMVSDMSSTATGEVTIWAALTDRVCLYGRDNFGLAVLDEGSFRQVETDWATLLSTSVTDELYLAVATTPAPEQDVEITFEDGTVLTATLPDTSDLEYGAIFAIHPDTGASYWLDEDRDGIGHDDCVKASTIQYTADVADDGWGGPATAAVVTLDADPRTEAALVQVANGAFELDPPGGFAAADSGALDDEQLLQLQHNVLELEVDSYLTHRPDYRGVSGHDGQLALRACDLSVDGWTSTVVEPGTVCVDASQGRVLFSSGNSNTGLTETGEVITHWGETLWGCTDGNGLMGVAQRESESGLLLYDISDPDNIVELGGGGAFWPYGCAIQDDRLYLFQRRGVGIWDISDPTAPVAGGVISPEGGYGAETIATPEGVLLGQTGEIHLIDGTDIDDPTALQSWYAPAEFADVYLMPIDDEWAYATDDETFAVYQLGETLTELASVTLELESPGANVRKVVRSGGFLYLSVASDGLIVIDVGTGEIVQREADVDPSANVDASGDAIIDSDHLFGVALADDGTLWTAGNNGWMDYDDSRRQFTTRVRQYEIAADGTVIETGRWETHGPFAEPWDLYPQSDDTLVVIDRQFGIRTVRMLDDGSWETVMGHHIAGLVNGVAFDRDGMAHTSEYLGGGMHLMSTDGTPASQGYVHRGPSTWGIGSGRSGHVYVGGRLMGTEGDGTNFNSYYGMPSVDVYLGGEFVTNIGGLGMYDLTDLGEYLHSRYYVWDMGEWPPTPIAQRGAYSSLETTLLDGRYVIHGPNGYNWGSSTWADGSEHYPIIVTDMAVPSAPVIVNVTPADDDECEWGIYGSVESAGDQVIFTRRHEMEIWDLSDPWNPVQDFVLTDEDLGQGVEQVEVRGDYMYLHGWNGEESVWDISGGLESPVLIDSIDNDTMGYRARLHGNIWAQTSYWGVTFFEVPRSDERPDNLTIRYYPDPDLLDSDADGTPDVDDACPADYGNDSDGDGSCDGDDVCPADPDDDADADGQCADEDPCPADPDDDADADGICGDVDLCPADPANDADGDGVCAGSDICEGGDDTVDSDGDTTPDACDACPWDEANDADGDGLCADEDSCPLDNPDDSDSDGSCDSDDACPNDDEDDADADGLCADVDPCPYDDVNDADGDGVCESDDNCPVLSNANQVDTDGDGTGDLCETDTDGDAIADDSDNCLYSSNADQADEDGDGIGDACDDDGDNDGVSDASDACDLTESGAVVDSDGCSVDQLCPCAHDSGEDKWKNHGAYVSCVAHAGGDLEDDGLISSEEKSDLTSDAGSSCCGHKKVDDECEDSDGDGWVYSQDCDDSDATAYPGAAELCDGVDNDCDGDTDEDGASDASIWYADTDGDGYGAAGVAAASCSQPSGYVVDATDCDDGRSSSYPGATEYCDGLDSDCDGVTDEDDASDASTWYADSDGDGFGGSTTTTVACYQPGSYSVDASDCDDADASAYPGADETCDGADDDCDGEIDEDDATDATTWYTDADQDGFGDDATAITQCEQLEGYATQGGDCDDAVAATHPGADEYCDAADNDCDGEVDEGYSLDATTWYADIDGDSYGDAASSSVGCEAPSGAVADATDCDDADSEVNPGATESCDSIDNDCDGVTDEADAIDAGTWYQDADGDGYGDPLVPTPACSTPSGHVSDDTDCDDQDPDLHPATEEICGDGVVNVCPDFASEALADCMAAEIDVMAESDATFTGNGGRTGSAVSSAGDVNGDGFDDVLIGAYGYNQNGSYSGSTYLLHGPVTGELTPADAGATIIGQRLDSAGSSLAAAGDLNGDGFDDIIVGAYNGHTTAAGAGAAFVFHGPIDGDVYVTNADAALFGEVDDDYAGYSLSPAGDLDGDGYIDIIVGATGEDAWSGGNGTAYLVFGPVTGESSLGDSDAVFIGEASGDTAGSATASVGDTNGDGLEDLLIGASGQDAAGASTGAAYLVLGDETRPSGLVSLADADAKVWGAASSNAGNSLSGAGDVNGDGYADFLVGAAMNDTNGTNSGAAYLVYGPAIGERSLNDAGLRFLGEGADCRAGYHVASAGDVNADGYSDVLIGARVGDDTSDDSVAYMIWGPIEGGGDLSDADVAFTGQAGWVNHGGKVASAGDVDADGYDDILIGAADNDGMTGAAYLFLAGSWF